jgi:hypothetical protein
MVNGHFGGRSAWWAAALGLVCIAHTLPVAAADGGYSVEVRALVGGSSVLVLTADQVGWFNRRGVLPGGAEGEPAVVNGKSWSPEWIGTLSTRTTVSDALPVPPDMERTFCRVISGRGDVSLQVSPRAALVTLDDTAHEGADWYEFEVFTADSLLSAQAGGVERLLEAQARVPRETSGSAGGDAGLDARIARQANQEAWLAAQAALSTDYEELQVAYFGMEDAAGQVEALSQAVAAARRDVAYWEAEVAEAQDKVLTRQRSPRVVHGVSYDYSWNNYWYRNWRRRLDDRRRSLQQANARLAEATRQLQAEQQRLAVAQAAYLEVKGRYDVKFAETYNSKFDQLKQDVAWRVEAQKEQQASRLQQEVEGRRVPGDYTIIHNGKTIGSITLFDDGTLTTVEGERRADYQWEVTPDGVLVRLRDIEWLLKPGPDETWVGRCLGPALEIKGLGLLLRSQ